MDKKSLYKNLESKDRNLDIIADNATNNTKVINFLIDGLSIGNTWIKYGCSNTLVIISKKHPRLLYPSFALFVKAIIRY